MRRLFLALTCLLLGVLVSGCGASNAATGNKTFTPNTVTGDDAHARDFARVEDMLRGQIAGVQVRQGPTGLEIRIRGGGSEGLSLSSGEPLFVIDGLPLQRSGDALVGINPKDIESIRVLKNASDTAFYGSQGANGVILITTRRPPPPGPGDA